MSRVNFDTLLEAGCHFGHLKRKWNPAMAPYIFMERNGIHIIDLNKTVAKVEEAAEALKQIAKSGKKILFVAIARTLGVAARLNPHDRSMEYMENGRFVPVLARTEKNCTLILKAGETVQWKYFQNWSIAKLEAGKYITRKLEAENFRDHQCYPPLHQGMQAYPLRRKRLQRRMERRSCTPRP